MWGVGGEYFTVQATNIVRSGAEVLSKNNQILFSSHFVHAVVYCPSH